MLQALQQEFLGFLTGQDSRFLDQVATQGNLDANTRGNIYKNAYGIRLKKAIETDHEILGLYLGDHLFDEMVVGYIRKYPSKYTSLRHFASNLPKYLKFTAPFNAHPLLAELAAFESLLLDVFDAFDGERANLATLQQIPPENWPEIRLRFHPSVQRFTTYWNSVESWQALKSKQSPATAVATAATHWLLWRGNQRLSEFRPLHHPEYLILDYAIQGADFASICADLLQWYQSEKVSAAAFGYLTQWLREGLIAYIDHKNPS